ncbi:MAG TPA: SMC-Scp complex subunit ScpB [Terracidiphilus sp.]|nr:SMC-Scp complex subunit ScpB [Terracidiphilus sp.]
MSLKAKLEAVIYASEEPVTLNQLAALFADEALEWRAEQENAAAQARASVPAAEPLPFINKGFDYRTIEAEASPEAEVNADRSPESADATAPESAIEPAGDEWSGPPAATEESAAEASAQAPETGTADQSPSQSGELSPEEAAKQASRQRDREIRLAIRELLDELVADYAAEGSGIEIREIAGGFRMATKPEYHDAVRAFVKSLKPALKLSLPALETLAVIAYKQPVTAPEVNEIRGVDSSGVFGSLLARKLISTAGRKQVVGRPILYKTTKEFLLRFGLKDIAELPSMEEFEKMAASELEADIESAEAGQSSAAEETGAENLETDGSAAPQQEAVTETEATPEPDAASTTSEAAVDAPQGARS